MRCMPAAGLGLMLALVSGQALRAQESVARIGKPVPVDDEPATPAVQVNFNPPAATGSNVVSADYNFAPAPGAILQTAAQDVPPPPPGIPAAPPIGVVPGGNEAYNCGVVTQNPNAPTGGFWSGVENWCKGLGNGFSGNGRKPFQSDQTFRDMFISPVTNPFYFEDPRALTELRPIFLFQGVPGGGTVFDFTLQGRLAITDWFSIVINKLGYIDATGGGLYGYGGGAFSELWLGPKFTFYRCESSGTVAAGGVTLELPVGGSNMAQNTGNLSLDPYLSLAQRVYRFSTYGTLNYMGTLGASFATDTQRSDHFYFSSHLDFDVGNAHKIYPLLELNYFNYFKNGSVTPISEEGKDLANLGSEFVSGKNDLSLAVGLRYKINDWWQLGVGADFPVAGNKDGMNYRLLFDMIFRF